MPILEKSFEDINPENLDMFSSFFSAIRSFVQEMVAEGELKTIEMGKYILRLQSIEEIAVDLVILADRGDGKRLKKVFDKISKILLEKKQFFDEWDGDVKIFKIFEHPIMKVIYNTKNLTKSTDTSSLLDNQSEVLQSMWSTIRSEEASDKTVFENLKKEREFFRRKLKKTNHLIRKIEIIDTILDIDKKLRGNSQFIEDQNLKINYQKELRDIKIKMTYYLERAKLTISETVESASTKKIHNLDYYNSYNALYSFGSKLKSIGEIEKGEYYIDMSKILLDPSTYNENGNFSEIISYILKMDDNINSYLS